MSGGTAARSTAVAAAAAEARRPGLAPPVLPATTFTHTQLPNTRFVRTQPLSVVSNQFTLILRAVAPSLIDPRVYFPSVFTSFFKIPVTTGNRNDQRSSDAKRLRLILRHTPTEEKREKERTRGRSRIKKNSRSPRYRTKRRCRSCPDFANFLTRHSALPKSKPKVSYSITCYLPLCLSHLEIKLKSCMVL